MRFPFHNDPAPEAMSPSHAKCQPQATTTLSAAVDLQGFALPIEVPASKTLHHAETTVKTVEHSLNQRVSLLLVQIPEPDFRSPDTPFPSDRLQVLNVDPTRFTNPIGQRTRRATAFDCTYHILCFDAVPMHKTMPVQLLFLRLMFGWETGLVKKSAVEQHVLNLAVVAGTHLREVPTAILLSPGVRGVAANAVCRPMCS